MAIKYVSKNKDGKWKVSATKTGSAVKVYPTQKEAIIYAAAMNDVDAIMVKRDSGWTLDSSWNQKVKEVAAKKVEAKKSRGKDASQAKAEVVAELSKADASKSTAKKTAPAKSTAKKPVAKKEVSKKVETKKTQSSKAKTSKKSTKVVEPKIETRYRDEIETQEISRVRKADIVPLSEMGNEERVTQVEGIVSSVVRPDATPVYTPYIPPVDPNDKHSITTSKKDKNDVVNKYKKTKTSKMGALIALLIILAVIGGSFAVAFLI